MSAILPSLDLVVNRLTTITVVQGGPQLKTTLAATPTETVIRTTSNAGVNRVNTTPIVSNTVSVTYPTSSFGNALTVVANITTTTTSNANSFAVTGLTSVLGSGLNYTYGSIVSNVSAYATQTYTAPGTYTWTCPTGVTSISMVGIGGGGGGQQRATGGSGGGGGLIDYYNAYPVTAGTSYTIVVGTGGGPSITAGNNGGATYFLDPVAVTPVIYASGGTGGGNINWVTGGSSASIINSTYTLIDTFTAQDSQGGSITYSIANGPTGLVINSLTGALSYTQQTSPSTTGSYLVTVTAISTSGGSISKFYTLSFTAEPLLYYLLVAGGGGAGTDGSVSAASPGTGGGGGVVLGSTAITADITGGVFLTVGAGGAVGVNGGNTSAIGTAIVGTNGIVAIGGGAGGSALTGTGGSAGGSGGGGGYSPGLVSGSGGAGLQPSSIWGGYGTAGGSGSQGGLGGSSGGTALSSFAAGSLLFNGSTQYLTVPADTKFQFGTGDWTIETWFYLNSTAGSVIIDMRSGITLNVAPMILVSTTLSYNVANTDRITGTTTLSTGIWYHVAVVKSSGSTKMYLNGSQEGSTYSDSNSYVLNSPVIGKFSGSGAAAYFGGYLTNLRIVKGTAIYTSAFAPTVPLANIANTSLLLLVNSDANKIVDSSSSPSTLTNNGGVTYSSSIIPSTGATGTSAAGSLVFNGSSYITYPNNAAWAFGSGAFTVECWFYLSSYTSPAAGLVMLWHAGPGRAFNFYVSSTLSAGWNTSSSMSGGSVSLNTWYHAAFVGNGSNFYLYLNGQQVATAAAATIAASTDPLIIGANNDSTSPTWFLNGYITNVRIVKGTAVYTSSFAPTVPLALVTNTVLLLSVSDNTNRAVDSSSNNFTPTVSGATFSSSVVPSTGTSTTTAGGSIYFNGTNATLTSPINAAFNLTADFTLEAWIYYQGSSSPCVLMSLQAGPSPGRGWEWFLYTDGRMGMDWSISGNGNVLSGGSYTATVAVTFNAWCHVALVRRGTTYTFYVNGAAAGSGTMSGAVNYTGSFAIGYPANETTGATYFKGYMTNMRIVNGTGVYSSTFTPTLLTAVTNTSLLLLVNSSGTYLTDSSVNNLTITSVNATYSSSQVPTVQGTNGPIAVNILGNIIASYSDGGVAANSSVNYGGGGSRVSYGTGGNAGVAYFWYAGLPRSTSGDTYQSVSYGGTNYWLHKFVNSQYFTLYTPGSTTPTLVDYIVVAGGGGGGFTQLNSGSGGGGGGGGIVTTAQYSTYLGGGVVSATNSAFAMGTSDFTVEGWAWIDPTCDALAGLVGSVSSTQQGFLFYRDGGGGILNAAGAGGSGVGWLTTLPTSTWFHFALTMESSTIRLYRDGIFQGSVARGVYANNATTISLGARYTDSTAYPFVGYITNVRVVSGRALYTTTGSFTVPTSPLTAVSGTVYLTATTAALQDMGPNQVAISKTGTVAYSSTQTPFASTASFPILIGTTYTVTVGAGGAGGTIGNGAVGGSSGLGTLVYSSSFGGSQYLTTGVSGSNFELAGSDFTMECWVYITSSATNPIWSLGTNGVFLTTQAGVDSNNSVYFQTGYYAPSSYWFIGWNGMRAATASNVVSNNTWTHIAFVRSGSTFKIFVNGTQQDSRTFVDPNSITVGPGGYTAFIGSYYGTSYFTGSISNFRLVRGVAVYTGNFSTPTTALLAVQSSSSNITAITGTQTSLLTLQSSTLVDNSTYGATIANVGTITTTTSTLNTASTQAVGGGGGGYAANASPWAYPGTIGGSGGGGAGGTASGAGNIATAGQGFAGAAGSSLVSAYGGGGGGGAGAAGAAGSAGAGGAGGAGTTTTLITTTQATTAVVGQIVTGNVYFAGGGGGGAYASNTGGAGGTGGGGAGNTAPASGTGLIATGANGIVNTGGGGGGAGARSTTVNGNGGSGGSGIVAIRYPSSNSPPTVGGLATSYTSGGYTTYIWTGSGTFGWGIATVLINYLVVGGGGGGSSLLGGAGGSVVTGSFSSPQNGSTVFTVQVGNGSAAYSAAGSDSYISGLYVPATIVTATGGAGAVQSGAGTAGTLSNIDGNAYYYGGGGGGGQNNGGVGGGGGGTGFGQGLQGTIDGTSPTVSSYLGVANFGGGGGAHGLDNTTTGGKGVVIIRWPATAPAATAVTGSPTVTISSGYRIYKFTSSGSITF